MKFRTLAIAAIVVIAAAASWIYRDIFPGGSSSSPSAATVHADTPPASPAHLAAAVGGAWQGQYGCDATCNAAATTPIEDAATAYSPEEAAWLARQGFLSRQDRARFEKMTQQEIERLVAADDGKAIIHAAMHPQRFPDIAPAVSGLAAQQGWTSASLLLGHASLEKAGKLREQATAAPSEPARRSLLREAEATASNAAVDLMKAAIRGDHVAARQVVLMHPGGIPTSMFELAVRSAAFDASAYKAQHGRSLQYDPRPQRPAESAINR